jgi:hypothetical protein
MLKGSLHEHFVPYGNEKTQKKYALNFWKIIQKKGFNFIATVSHNSFENEKHPKKVYNLLKKTMPSELVKRNFMLIPAMEITSEGIHIIAMNNNPEILFEEAKQYSKMNLEQTLEKLKKKGCTVFFPHPNSLSGVNWHNRDIKQLIQKYGLGIETFNGATFNTKKVIDLLTLGLLKKKTKTLNAFATQENAKFITSSQDAKHIRTIGDSYITINSNANTINQLLQELKQKQINTIQSKKNNFRNVFWDLIARRRAFKGKMIKEVHAIFKKKRKYSGKKSI